MTGTGYRKSPMEVLDILTSVHSDAAIALRFSNPFELLVATILSAQCTDMRVNQVTLELFRKYPDVRAFAEADLVTLENDIRPTGFFRNKAKNIIACARVIVEKYAGAVPSSMEELTALPGVGRKTANVVRGDAFALPGLAVDTHVKRVSFRLGWTAEKDPEKIEKDLSLLFPREKWSRASHVLIFHGRRICKAPIPSCSACPVLEFCPRAGVSRSR